MRRDDAFYSGPESQRAEQGQPGQVYYPGDRLHFSSVTGTKLTIFIRKGSNYVFLPCLPVCVLRNREVYPSDLELSEPCYCFVDN